MSRVQEALCKMLNLFIMIPFVNLKAQREAYRNELEIAEQSVLDSGCYIGGACNLLLEKELASYCGAKYAITCASGTDAISIALKALDLKPGDEVIVPDFTFIAPAECVFLQRAIPKFADIDPKTLQISVESVKELINSKTKGIIAVNLFGQCAPYSELQEIAQKHNLWLLEDSAQAFGATQNSRKACTFGDISITSFYPTKPLGCYGDGGALFTNSDSLSEKIRLIANHGSKERYKHEICGTNSRLDALQAAILHIKLGHLDEELSFRRRNASVYNNFFEKYTGIIPQQICEGNTSTYAQYTILAENRLELLKLLESARIPYCIHYPKPLHEQPCFESVNNSVKNEFTESICKKVVSLPICAFTDIQEIIQRMEKAFSSKRTFQ